MRKLHIYILAVLLMFLSACETDLLKTFITEGTAPIATASSSQLVLARADSANTILTLNWTDPKYLDDTSNGNVVGAYFVEIDLNESFSKPTIVEMGNTLELSYSVYKLNKLVIKMGCETDVPSNLFVRVKSVFFSSDTLTSNVLTLTVTPYSTVIPPAIAVPAELFITGDATIGGWNKPLPANQKFTQLTPTTFMITVDLKANGTYALITDVAGNQWTPCYKLHPNTDPASVILGGSFVQDGEGSEFNWTAKNFVAPDKDGTYKLTFNFQDATFTVEDVTGVDAMDIPAELYIVGDATAAGWGDVSAQKFTKLSASVFTINIDLKGNSAYALITDPTGVNWTPCYRIDPANDPATMVDGGTFVQDGDGSKYSWSTKNFISPEDDGKYTLTFDFVKGTYTVVELGPPAIEVPAELWIWGDGLAGGWVTPFPAERKFTKISDTKFTITIAIAASTDYEMIVDGTGANWTPCYRIDPALDRATMIWGGSFVWDGEGSAYSWGSKKFLSPDWDGTFIITMDFQTATFTVEEQ
jgi:hypothetical protein